MNPNGNFRDQLRKSSGKVNIRVRIIKNTKEVRKKMSITHSIIMYGAEFLGDLHRHQEDDGIGTDIKALCIAATYCIVSVNPIIFPQ